MIDGQDLRWFSTPAELARIVENTASAPIGLVVSPEQCATLFDALEALVSGIGRKVTRIARCALAVDRMMLSPKPPENPAFTPSEWRERFIAELREEQRRAQQRVQEYKQTGTTPDPSDRDTASWLAAGLCDLLGDPITGASFLIPGKGAIARLATGDSEARFAETDFLRPETIRFMEAGRAAQSMLTKLSLSSTNQFRVTAARLMNRIVDRLAEARTETVSHPTLPEILLVEDAELLANFVPGEFTGGLVVAGADDDLLRKRLPASALLYRYAEPVGAIIEPELPAVEIDPLTAAFETEAARARLFVGHGVLTELPQAVFETRSESALSSLRNALARAWRQWFSVRLADLDAERFVSFEKFSRFARTIALLQDSWKSACEVSLPVPVNARDFDLVESIIAELHQLQREWSIELFLENAHHA
jgi:hypothetical protein